jgi:mRNA-degrading endonuclease toxin of MazEF toxin-antitoxin module
MGANGGGGYVERISRGDVWTFAPAGFPKPRPAVVISINPINELCPDVLLIPITSRPGPLRISVEEDASVSGLRVRSYAKCEVLGPAHKSRLKKRIGRISPERLLAIEEGVRRVLGLR